MIHERAKISLRQTGIGVSAIAPVGVSAPEAGSMAKVTMLSESWLAACSGLAGHPTT